MGIKNETVRRMIEENGSCLAVTFPGMYTIIYLDSSDNVFCSECATKHPEGIETVRTYDEGPTFQCHGCGVELKSSYGDPEDDNDES